MINIQPYINELEELKERMDFFIEVLWTRRYFENFHIVEETKQGRNYIEEFNSSKIFPLPMSHSPEILKRLELIDYLKNEIKEYIGIHTEREVKIK